ncbi:PREDICTED: uncharacterized protein LOC106810321 [Priapulus caudatus]|uniref:Uncharacterized protein LOC106810321 n=1 Tax=Priapulus caudatus TaxID=37621 RepID=A0ABM1EA92_PRICU|nr:PREDICTED: uncharacterized protein LOC106810321 [Priapulus caudatus]
MTIMSITSTRWLLAVMLACLLAHGQTLPFPSIARKQQLTSQLIEDLSTAAANDVDRRSLGGAAMAATNAAGFVRTWKGDGDVLVHARERGPPHWRDAWREGHVTPEIDDVISNGGKRRELAAQEKVDTRVTVSSSWTRPWWRAQTGGNLSRDYVRRRRNVSIQEVERQIEKLNKSGKEHSEVSLGFLYELTHELGGA